jgi:hypothetical protein
MHHWKARLNVHQPLVERHWQDELAKRDVGHIAEDLSLYCHREAPLLLR